MEVSFAYPQQPAPAFGTTGTLQQPPQGWQPMPPQPTAAPAQDKGDTEGLALLAVVILFHVLLNVYWLRADNHLIHLDEAHHINRAAAYYEVLFPAEESGWFERMVATLSVESPYPPLTHLAGAGLIRVWGDSPDTVALSGSLFLALFLLGVYLFARQGMTARNAFLAAFVAGFMPFIYGGSRYVMPDLLLAAMVVWALYALLKSDRFRKTGWAALFGFFCGLALLTKQTAPIYLLLPTVWILGWSVWSVIYPASSPVLPTRRKRATQLLFSITLCVCIVLGVCSWWYTRHLEYTYTWWSTQRGGATGLLQPGIASRIEFALPDITEDAESHIYLDPEISRLTAAPGQSDPQAPNSAEDEQDLPEPEEALENGDVEKGESAADDADENDATEEAHLIATEDAAVEPAAAETATQSPHPDLLEPLRRDWSVYPIYFVNEAVFLPLALCALFGLPALLLRRNRNAMTRLMLVWLGGAYLLLTGVFTARNPQLLYAAAPPAAILCALALDAVPRYRLRRALWGVLICFLLAQYVNLTLFSYGPLRRLEIPALSEHPAVRAQHNNGLTVYKDRIELGHYTLHPPQRGEVITETLIAAIAAYEESRQQPEGAAAWYQVVSDTPAHLGVDFYARRAAPAQRPIAPVKWESRMPEDTLPELAETEYVILKQGLDGDYIARLEACAAFFKPHGFESIFNRPFAGYGRATPGYAHVMARKEVPALDDNPDIFELYDLLERDGKHWLLTEEQRKEAESRYAQMVRGYTHIQPLNDKVNLLGFHVKHAADDWYVLRLIVHAKDTPANDIRIWLRGLAHPDDRDGLLQPQQALETLVWDFAPQPEATAWQPNQALVLSRPVMAAPLRYQFEMGILGPGQTNRPTEVVETEDWVDFAEAR